MPQTIKDADGNDVEVFTSDELQAKAKEEADRVAGEKQVEFDALQAEKAEIEEKFQKLSEKEMNFEKVRRKAEGKDDATEELNKKIEELNKKIDGVALRPVEDTKAEFIKNNVGEDKEKVALFEYYFKRLGTDAKTKDEVLKASKEALTLATGGEYKPNTDSQVFSAGGSGYNYRESNTSVVSEESKSIGKLFGNTEKELAEHKKKGNK